MTSGFMPQSGTGEVLTLLRLIFGILAIFWLVNLVPGVQAVVSGAPDQYHNQHWRAVTLTGGSLLLALGMVIRRGRVQYILVGMSLLGLGISNWLAR
ncbi:MAG TPA: hypothetical protein VFN22_04140 [Gemmatimonadales bacterium]|nr:hypothetical protein [Gemmatimonadales bacterium]